jgi:hypothetical protein
MFVEKLSLARWYNPSGGRLLQALTQIVAKEHPAPLGRDHSVCTHSIDIVPLAGHQSLARQT